MKGRKRRRNNDKSILTYGKVKTRLLRDIPGTKWLPSDSEHSSKDIFGDSTNSFLNTFSEKLATVNHMNRNKALISSESDDDDFVEPKIKKSLRKCRNAVTRQPDGSGHVIKVPKVRGRAERNLQRTIKGIIVGTQTEHLINLRDETISENAKESVAIADLNEQNSCVQCLNPSEKIGVQESITFSRHQEYNRPDISMISNLSLHNTVLHHAPDIEMENVPSLIPSEHVSEIANGKLLTQSTPLISRISTRSFFKNKLSSSTIRCDISDKPPAKSVKLSNKNAKEVRSKTPNDQNEAEYEFAVPLVTIAPKKNSTRPSTIDYAKLQDNTNLSKVTVAKTKAVRKTVKVRRPKKAPAWKKCPGTNMKAKQKMGRTKNDSILQQIMVNGNVDVKFRAASDSLIDIYRVDNTESFEKSFQIKLPRNRAPASEVAIEKKDNRVNRGRKLNKKEKRTPRKTNTISKNSRRTVKISFSPGDEKSVIFLPQPVVVVNMKDQESSVSRPQSSDRSYTLSIDEKDILMLSSESSGKTVTKIQEKSKIQGSSQSKSVEIETSSGEVFSSSKSVAIPSKGVRKSRRKRAVINYKDLSLGKIGWYSEEENKLSAKKEEPSFSDGKTDIKGVTTICEDSKKNSNNISVIPRDRFVDPAARVTSPLVRIANHINCRGRKKRLTAPVVQSDSSSLFSTLNLTSERHMTSVHSSSMIMPMHAFSTINVTENEQHGGILSDDENVKTGPCVAKRVSTPLVAGVLPVPPNNLYNTYVNTPHKEAINTVVKQPIVSEACYSQDTCLKSPLEAFSPITLAPLDQYPSRNPGNAVSPPLLLDKIIHPRLTSLKHHERTTSTPNSNRKRKINSTEQGKSVFSPIPNSIKKVPMSGMPSCTRRQRIGSYIGQTSTPRRPRSPGSHLSSSKTQLSDEPPPERRHTMDLNHKSQLLDSVKMDLSSLLSENDEELRNQNHSNQRIPDIYIEKRLSLQCVSNQAVEAAAGKTLHLSESVVCIPRQSIGFVDALTPRRARTGTGRILTSREKVLCECEQSHPIPFEESLSDIITGSCMKLGEGLYGEVYRCHYKGEDEPVALKVIPIEGKLIVNEEKQKTFEEMLPEVVSSKELHALRNHSGDSTDRFIELKKIMCVQGTYPNMLIDAWDRYNQEGTSENDRPNAFISNQLYLVFKFADGGTDVEHFRFKTARQAYSVLQQVCVALAVAERTLEFEHRDLHWGNILVAQTKDQVMSFRVDNKPYEIKTHGVKASIIDFTLSRISKGGVTVFQDLAADPSLFTMDGAQDYQFEIYRMMKQVMINEWSRFEPVTNVYWLHYLTDKFRNKVYFSNKKYKYHRSYMVKLLRLWEDILFHKSCYSMLKNSKLINEGMIS